MSHKSKHFKQSTLSLFSWNEMLSCSQAEHQIKITQFSQKHAPAPAPIVPFTHLSQTTESCLQYLVTCNPTLHQHHHHHLGFTELESKSSFFFRNINQVIRRVWEGEGSNADAYVRLCNNSVDWVLSDIYFLGSFQRLFLLEPFHCTKIIKLNFTLFRAWSQVTIIIILRA